MSGKWEDNELRINRVKRPKKAIKTQAAGIERTWDGARLGKRKATSGPEYPELRRRAEGRKRAGASAGTGTDALSVRRRRKRFIKASPAAERVYANEMPGVIVGRKGQDKVSARLESIDAAAPWVMSCVTLLFLWLLFEPIRQMGSGERDYYCLDR